MPALPRPSLPSVDVARLAARIALAYIGRQEGQSPSFTELCRTTYHCLLSCAPDTGPPGAHRQPSRPADGRSRRLRPQDRGPGSGDLGGNAGEFPV